jgi:hypothetical protein
MSIEELSMYLDQLDSGSLPFCSTELTEPLLESYMLLRRVLRDHCAVIELSDDQVTWKRQVGGESVGRFSTPVVSTRPFFKLVVKRDPQVRRHVHLDAEDEDVTRYCIS